MQSRLGSFIEVLANTLIGLAVALMSSALLYKLYGIEVSTSQNVQMTLWMTVISIVRSYWMRRLWNARFWEVFIQMWAKARGLHG